MASLQTTYYPFQQGIKFRWIPEIGSHTNLSLVDT
jgi:hypothetical protein